ncbi:MAG TPA: hypothetical protein VIU41_13140, partial [Geobacteraceae bacterium]
RTFTVTNNSADELAITDIRLIGPDTAYFAVDYGSCLTSAPHIPGGGNCSVSVAFTPPGGAAGGYRAQLAVSSGSSSQPATVAHLKGQAVYAAAPDGDVTDDGAVSLPDALKVLRIAIDMAEPQANDWAHGDVAPLVNGKPKPDGSIGIDDAFTILRKATGLIVF